MVFYSILLKKATVQNIVIGGGAGAIPPMVGWAAATGHLSLAAWILFLIIFMWTPPHFWALAIVRMKDYEKAGVPMLPVVKGEKTTRSQILIYTLILVGTTLLLPIIKATGIDIPCLCHCAGRSFDFCCMAGMESAGKQSGLDDVSLVQHVPGVHLFGAGDRCGGVEQNIFSFFHSFFPAN